MSILPSNKSSFDKKLDNLVATRFNKFDLTVINNLPLLCHKKLLPILANSFDVDIDKLEEKEARNLIYSAFKLHYYSGTSYALKEVLKNISTNIELLEWFEYKGEPYHFKVEIDITDKAITDEFRKGLENTILKYKNVRSVLEEIILSYLNKYDLNIKSSSLGETTASTKMTNHYEEKENCISTLFLGNISEVSSSVKMRGYIEEVNKLNYICIAGICEVTATATQI